MANPWSYDQALVSHALCLATYCGAAEYSTYNFAGVVEGFQVTHIIDEPINDIEGYIGYLPSDQSIYVAFRGTESPENWAVDFDSGLEPYDVWPECNCRVHTGFNEAVKLFGDEMVAEVKKLQAKFPTYEVKTTGHSLGAAMAQMSALYLLRKDV